MSKEKMMSYIEIENDIIERIGKHFPAIRIYKDSYSNENENYILIDNEDVYNGSEFKRLVLDIKKNLLLINGIGDIYFSYISSHNELTQNAIKLYEPPEVGYFVNADIRAILVRSTISVKINDINGMYNGSIMAHKEGNIGGSITGENIIWANSYLAKAA